MKSKNDRPISKIDADAALRKFGNPKLPPMPADYYKCKECNDTQYLTTPEGLYPCICAIRNAKMKHFGDLYLNKTLTNFEGRNASQREAKRIIVSGLAARPLQSFYIFGNVGLGKTHLLAGIFESLYRSGIWQNALVLKESALADFIRSASADSIKNTVKEKSVFFVDDLGKIKIAPWERELLFNFYDDVYRFEKPIFISSNYSLPEIMEYYGAAITRRIDEKSVVLEIKGGQ